MRTIDRRLHSRLPRAVLALAVTGLLATAGAAPASAQGREMTLRLGGDLVFPRIAMSDAYNDVSPVAFGPLVRAELGLMDTLTVTWRFGGLIGTEGTGPQGGDVRVSEIPFLFGAKYFVVGDWKSDGFHVGGELGFVTSRFKRTGPFGGGGSDGNTEMALHFGGGYEFGKSRGWPVALDARLGFWFPSLTENAGDNVGLLLSLGATFDAVTF